MARKNNKNKKIAKPPKPDGQPLGSRQLRQQEQSIQQMHGQFEHLAEDSHPPQDQMGQQTQTHHLLLNEATHFVHILESGCCFRVTNLQSEDISLAIVDGTAINNGSWLKSKAVVRIRGNGSAVLEAFQELSSQHSWT